MEVIRFYFSTFSLKKCALTIIYRVTLLTVQYIKDLLNTIRQKGLYPDVKVIEGIAGLPKVRIGGIDYLQFCSANYLGLTTNQEIIKAIKDGIDRYGIHPTGSRLVSGTQDIHIELERKLAEFKKTPDSMVLVGGVMANMGVIPAVADLPFASLSSVIDSLLGRMKTVIFSDKLNHASIIDGIKLAKTQVEVYRHKDTDDLEKRLRRHKNARKFIITDGVFSMNGDIAPLPKIVAISKEYGAFVMVDDAHGTGILGENGRGTVEHFGLSSNDIAIHMGTFSKAFGVSGGYIAGDKDLVDYLRVATRTYMFTGGFLGGLAAGVLAAITLVDEGSGLRKQLWENTAYLRKGLKRLGYNTLGSETPIVPILIGDEQKAIALYEKLFANRIFAPCFRWPATAKGEAIIRFTVTALHTREHLDVLLNKLETLK